MRNAKDLRQTMTELSNAYPETAELDFLTPEPLADIEAHLKASRQFFPLKADGFLVRIAENLALIARPLSEALSCVAESPGSIDSSLIAEKLSDIAKGLMLGAHLTESARIDLICSAFKVPTSAAKPERGVSLLGSTFARTVASTACEKTRRYWWVRNPRRLARSNDSLCVSRTDSRTDREVDDPFGSGDMTAHRWLPVTRNRLGPPRLHAMQAATITSQVPVFAL